MKTVITILTALRFLLTLPVTFPLAVTGLVVATLCRPAGMALVALALLIALPRSAFDKLNSI